MTDLLLPGLDGNPPALTVKRTEPGRDDQDPGRVGIEFVKESD
jgi:hypothetical protein